MSVSRVRGLSLATLALGVLVAGCSAAPGSGGSVSGGGNGGPTAGPAGSECDGVPTFNVLASPQPSFATDATLLAEFPKQVAGQPIDNVQAVPMLTFVCFYLGGQATVDQFRTSLSRLGWNISDMSYGSFDTTVQDETVSVTAIRFPGQDAGSLIANFGLFGAFAGINIAGDGLTDANVGGKTVKTTQADSDGTKSYFYTHGDTLFLIQDATDDQATAILQALP